MSSASNENIEFQKVVAIVGVSLMAMKFLAYFMTGSVSIFTDAMESIVNVVAAFVGLYALYVSARPADRDYPFGHGKIETVSSSVEGTLITIAGLLIIYESIVKLLHPGELTDLDIGLVLIAITAAVNLAVGRSAIRRGRKNRSPALEASGKHLCSDTVSSVGIIVGLMVLYAAQSLGYDARWLDALIAMVFGAIIIRTGLKVIRECLRDFMDGADKELLTELSDTLNEHRHHHWIDVYGLRTIKYGTRIFVNLHAVLPRTMTLERSDVELSEVEEAFRNKYGDSVEVSITAVPCMEFSCRYCRYDCQERSAGFERELEWTPATLCCVTPHAADGRVVINLDGTK
ncbi:MAG: cation transporter [Candidatus Methanomethylophilaceae archaeon]|nr:cation transporter [Candidatus Methanomethylophilaceae archaeon]